MAIDLEEISEKVLESRGVAEALRPQVMTGSSVRINYRVRTVWATSTSYKASLPRRGGG
ncbi:hypothetical protein [Pseudomonas cremoricolorata]|uniref:hypothetical protein n=1 Tax=Pseudomonas cremoricolorata TaxID=157783 RepID=UPI001FE09A68|nr:hypothetical protein [Pseudomonas cremoricolorata]